MITMMFVIVGLAILAAGLIPEYHLPTRSRPSTRHQASPAARHLRRAS